MYYIIMKLLYLKEKKYMHAYTDVKRIGVY